MKISGWGRYPWIDSKIRSFETAQELKTIISGFDCFIPHGMGRSYGDSALQKNIVKTRRFDKIIAFDPKTAIVTCESGILLSELIDIFLPKGFFLSVTPGTKLITVGGAIGSDVHGKNHHSRGCFSDHVLSFELMLPDGQIVTCSRTENQDLFLATCGGMGLTGIILTVTMKLAPVNSAYIRETIVACRNLKEIFERFEEYYDFTYSVAWIDCLAKGRRLGRSILMLGEHATAGRINIPGPKNISIPIDIPHVVLNQYSIKVFNQLYYALNAKNVTGRLTPLDTFFYPLDKIDHWNRLYGNRGLTQYQFVLPKSASYKGMRAILGKIVDSGMGSFLAVLKLFGPQNDNWLSFPMEGYTLALDFKIQKKLFPLLDELDAMVVDYGGRIYLTKDVRMKKNTFQKGYSSWETFVQLREEMGMSRKIQSLQSKRLGV